MKDEEMYLPEKTPIWKSPISSDLVKAAAF